MKGCALKLLKIPLCLVFLLLTVGHSFSQTAEMAWEDLVGTTLIGKKAYAFVDNRPDFKNVLIYGDSISVGYTAQVRKKLANKANVYRIYCNGGSSSSFVEKMNKMQLVMGDESVSGHWSFDWDVIYFNVGLHDLRYLRDRDRRVTTVAEYKDNLEDIAQYLINLAPDATLVFATTTPVVEGSKGREAGDAKIYNEAAFDVFERYPQIIVHDLYSFTKPCIHEWQKSLGDVHFNSIGRRAQGAEVARVLLDVLKNNDEKMPFIKGPVSRKLGACKGL